MSKVLKFKKPIDIEEIDPKELAKSLRAQFTEDEVEAMIEQLEADADEDDLQKSE